MRIDKKYRARLDHLKGMRRFIEVKPSPVTGSKKSRNVTKYREDPAYLGSVRVVTNNLPLLKECFKSGSWVQIKILGQSFAFWTSRKLTYFSDITKIKKNRNFGIGIITKSEMKIFENVTIESTYFNNSLNIYNRRIRANENFGQLHEGFYLCVNGSEHFQHFVQDFLPILVSIRSELEEKHTVPIILNKPSINFQNFDYFFNILGVSNPKIFVDNDEISVKKLHFLDFEPKNAIYCLPSEMYENLFDEILRKKVFIESKKQNLVCFIRNAKTRNFANLDFVKKELSNWADIKGLNPVFVNPDNVSINHLIDLLSNAKFVFGAHGGAIYNMLFAARNSTLIEFIATDATDSLMHIVRSFGQGYLPYAVRMDKGSPDFKVSKKDLNSIFECLENNY